MDSIKYSFSAGELAPELFGRSDLERYDLAAKTLHNAVVNYGGGAFKRPGTRFVEYLAPTENPVKSFSFKFSEDRENTYLVIFGDGYIRFMQDGAYVLRNTINVTGTAGSVATSAGHPYEVDDLVYFANYDFITIVTAVTANTFTVTDIFGNAITLPAGATTAQRTYSITHPYDTDELAELRTHQVFDTIKFTHQNYPPYLLRRLSGQTWSFTEESRAAGLPLDQQVTITHTGKYIAAVQPTVGGSGYTRASIISASDTTGSGFKATLVTNSGAIDAITIIDPGFGYTNPTFTATVGTGAAFEAILSNTNAGYVVAISANLADGSETGITRPALIRDSVDFTQTKGSATYSWAAVPNAVSYNVYRSLVHPDGEQVHIGMPLGFIGTVRGTKFVDTNITPDFTRTPKTYEDPFVPGAIEQITVTNGGTGYNGNSDLEITNTPSPITEAVTYPIVDKLSGAIIGVYLADPGEGYSNPGVTSTDGSGVAVSVSYRAATGIYPAASTVFQQRNVYAGTIREPMTIWGSRYNSPSFAKNEILTEGDPYKYSLDLAEVQPILHLVAGEQGLLVFTTTGVSLLLSRDGEAVTPLNAVAFPQSFAGATNVPPELVDEDILYVQEKFRGLRLLTPAQNARRYDSREISILARHFFKGLTVRAMAFAYDTEKRGYGIYGDGTAFSVTIDRSQELFAFSRIATRGRFRDVNMLNVGDEEHFYFQTEREVNGHTLKMIEIMRPPLTDAPEDAIHFDAALQTTKIHPAGRVSMSAAEGVITVTANANLFSSGDVGKVFWANGGRGFVTGYTNATTIEVTLTRPITRFVPETTIPADATVGNWWLNPLITTVSGIPFEGEYVSVLVDGKEHADKLVTNGTITLDMPAAMVTVGLRYNTIIRTLPLASQEEILEGKQLKVNYADIRVRNAGVFTVGGYDMPYRSDEAWSEPTRLEQEPKSVTLGSGWDTDGSIEIVSNNGLPLEVLQVTVNVVAS